MMSINFGGGGYVVLCSILSDRTVIWLTVPYAWELETCRVLSTFYIISTSRPKGISLGRCVTEMGRDIIC